jgi:hypothetical protein
MEEWAKELSRLVETFVEIRTTEEEVERQAMERQAKWGVFSIVARVFGGIRWSTKRRRGTGRRRKATLNQRAATLRDQVCEFPPLLASSSSATRW